MKGDTSMFNRKPEPQMFGIAKRTIAGVGATAALGLLLGGCSSSASAPPPEVAAMEKTELHFSLDQCERMSDANLYKCPAIDKPICNPDYNDQLNCVRVGRDGSVYVQKAID
jgi:hypothetical protein